jgi:hypothetical protein
MRFLRAGAIVAVAAALVTGWTVLQPRIGQAISSYSHFSSFSLSGPTTYYIRPGGSNTAPGTSPAAAWRTLARASRAVLKPGDRLLLLGRHAYAGQLTLNSADAGNVTKPVVISSYGTGRPTITSRANGIMVFDTEGVIIRNLVITGHGAFTPKYAGIQLFSDRAKGRLGHVFISRVNVSRFGFGVSIGAIHDGAGFRHVRVTSSSLHNNLDAGLVSYGPDYTVGARGYAHQDIYVSRVRAFRNPGDPQNTIHNTGSGIQLGSVRGATISYSQTFANGGSGGTSSEGPIGMWAYDSTRVVMNHNVSFRNKSSNVHDGGGFGLDKDTSDSVLEYNLSYGNHGVGLLLYNAPTDPIGQTGNVVRFNISYGDATESRHVMGGMAAGGRINNATFYQNTVVMTGSRNEQPAFKVTGIQSNVRVLNNILISAAGPVVETVQPKTARQVFLAGNDYCATAGRWVVQWGPKEEFFSLAGWRSALGQERVAGMATGTVASPLFIGPLTGSSDGVGFVLRPVSKLLHAGLDLKLRFGINAGKISFSGRAYPVRNPNVGAQ